MVQTSNAIFSVRVASPLDVDGLCKLCVEVQDLHVQARPDHFRTLPANELAGWFRQLLSESLSKVWLAELDGQLVGYAVASIKEPAASLFHKPGKRVDLDQIGVSPGYRRRAIASALLNTVLSHARSVGIAKVELQSWSFNQEAHCFFLKHGFSPRVVRFEFNLDD